MTGLARDPGVRHAALLSLGLWSLGFLLYIALMAFRDAEVPTPDTLAIYLVQFLTGMGLAGILIVGIRGSRAWSKPARWATVCLLVPPVTAVMAVVDNLTLIYLTTHGHPDWSNWAYWSLTWAVRTAFIYFWVFCVNTALIHLAFTIDRVRDSERELAEVRATAVQAQLAMLRYQLNPHFLFNTLNAISSLVVTGRVKSAEEMIDRLSAFLRETLTSDSAALVSVEEELALTQDYLAIESIRFRDRLRIAINCDAAAGAVAVPSFILQPIVENAVKHGVGPSMTPVTITITAVLAGPQLVVRVCDDGQGQSAPGTGVGLNNIRQRLAAHYRDQASIEAGREEEGYVVELRMPRGPLNPATAA